MVKEKRFTIAEPVIDKRKLLVCPLVISLKEKM